MIFNGKEYFVDFVTVDENKNETYDTFRNFEEVRFFIDNGIEMGTISKDGHYRIQLSEKNYDDEMAEDAFWQGVEVDFDDLDATIDSAAMEFAIDLFQTRSEWLNNNPIDLYLCVTKIVLKYMYKGQEIKYYKSFKNPVELNKFIRANLDKGKLNRHDEGYKFSVEITPDGTIPTAEQFVLSYIDIEPDMLRPTTPAEIAHLYFTALLNPFDEIDIENFDYSAGHSFFE